MLSRTHGQPCKPEHLGKEMANIVPPATVRKAIASVEMTAKFNGAVGTTTPTSRPIRSSTGRGFNQRFIESLGLGSNPNTIQIEPHDSMAELFDAMARCNTIPRRRLPRHLELHLAGLLQAAPGKARWVRPPCRTRSTPSISRTPRATLASPTPCCGTSRRSCRSRACSATSLIRRCCATWGWPSATPTAGLRLLPQGPQQAGGGPRARGCRSGRHLGVLAEPIQTVMRRYGVENPYEQLKALTRGRASTARHCRSSSPRWRSPRPKARLLEMTPASYIGKAAGGAADLSERGLRRAPGALPVFSACQPRPV